MLNGKSRRQSSDSGGRRDRATAIFLVLSLVAVLVATLLPFPESDWTVRPPFPSAPRFGDLADVLENVLLFVPIGLALGLRRMGLAPTALVAAALSWLIESAQTRIPGRFAATDDVIANIAGVMLAWLVARSSAERMLREGLRRAARAAALLLRPSPSVGRNLVYAGASVVTLVFLSTGLLLRPSVEHGPCIVESDRIDPLPGALRIGGSASGDGFFRGIIDEVRLYDHALSPEEIRRHRTVRVAASPDAGTPGLVAAWGFDEEDSPAKDASGHHHDGRITGAAWTPRGRFGGALAFDGDRAVVVVADAPDLRLTSGFTIEAWALSRSPRYTWPVIVQKEGDAYFLYFGSDQGPGRVSAGGLFGGRDDGVTVADPVARGVWTHLAATYDGAAVSVWIDGRLGARRTRWFGGRFVRASLGDVALSSGRIPDCDGVRASLFAGAPLRVQAVDGAPRPVAAPLFKITGPRQVEEAALVVDGEDVVYRWRSRAEALGLRSPASRARGALASLSKGRAFGLDTTGGPQDPAMSLDGKPLRLRAPSLASGWEFVVYAEPFPLTFRDLLDAVWVAALFLPLGYWSGASPRELAMTAIPFAALLGLPFSLDVAPTPPHGIVAALGALVLGAILARRPRGRLGADRLRPSSSTAAAGAERSR